MTTRTFTFTVQAAGSSALAQAAAALSSGSWGALAMNGLDSSWTDGGDSFLSYCPHGEWDTLHKKLVFIGATHPNTAVPYLTRQFDYTDSTNTWARDNSTIPPGSGGPDHGYYHTAVNPATGDIYWRRYAGGTTVYKRPYGGSWGAIASTPLEELSQNVASALVWHPGLFGGTGGVIHGNWCGIAAYNPLTNAWTSLRAVNGTMGTYHNAGVYNRADQCVYVGGGNGSTALWKVTAAGVVSQAASAPVAFGADLAGQAALYSSTGSNRMVLLSNSANGKAIYEYNHAANTWASLGTYPFSYSNSFAGFTCDDYGCLVFVMTTSANTIGSTAYIWKR